ncbi:MAG: hypothetical protein JOY71_01000, partial [Acetobacteraceae bacterium]|nr:hypothetical protein [Acetobacteraceae bacterium]
MLPYTTSRVEQNTASEINQQSAEQIASRARHYAVHPEQIDQRVRELDAEWDIERTLETNAAALGLAGTLLGAFVDRRFLILPAVVTGFLLQHA